MIVVFSFLIIDVFDNAGTLIGVTHRAGLLDAEGNLPRMKAGADLPTASPPCSAR